MPASPTEVRAAREFLFRRGAIAQDVPPRKFANAAKEMNLSFIQLLGFLSRLYSGGQNMKQFRIETIARLAEKESTQPRRRS